MSDEKWIFEQIDGCGCGGWQLLCRGESFSQRFCVKCYLRFQDILEPQQVGTSFNNVLNETKPSVRVTEPNQWPCCYCDNLCALEDACIIDGAYCRTCRLRHIMKE